MKNARAKLFQALHRATGYRFSHAEAQTIADQQLAILGLAEAEAEAEAREKGEAEAQTRTQQERLAMILRSREASANPDEAMRLALDTDLPAPEAVRILRGLRAPETTLPSLAYETGHDLGPNVETGTSEEIDHATARSVLNLYAGARQRITR